jgi:hypothetical protein
MNPSKIINAIRAELGPHLVKSKYLKHRPADATPSWGCCYVATEALYHLWGKAHGYIPMRVPFHINRPTLGIHWFLEQRASGLQVDITADQFTGRHPNYTAAKGGGFLTKYPSERARKVIDAVLEKIPL